MDILATMTPAEYQIVKLQLSLEGLWSVFGATNDQVNQRAVQILRGIRN